jgi:hypothetical protein
MTGKGLNSLASNAWCRKPNPMTEAKLGLIIVALLITGFAIAMRFAGALRMATTVTAIVVTIGIAASLFVTQ